MWRMGDVKGVPLVSICVSICASTHFFFPVNLGIQEVSFSSYLSELKKNIQL